MSGDVLLSEVLDKRLNKFQKEILKKVNQKDNCDTIADEILWPHEQRGRAEVDSVIKDEQMKQIRTCRIFIKGQPPPSQSLMRCWTVSRLIKKITVFDDHFDIDFISGITMEIQT